MCYHTLPSRQGQMLTCPIILEIRRCTKLLSQEERYVNVSAIFISDFESFHALHIINSSIYANILFINQSHIDQEVVMLLLHYGACATVINGTAQIPKDVTQNEEIRSMLEGERDILSAKRWKCVKIIFFMQNAYIVPTFSSFKSCLVTENSG